MPIHYQRAQEYLKRLFGRFSESALAQRLAPKPEQSERRVPRYPYITPEMVERRWEVLAVDAAAREQLLEAQTLAQMERYQRNIENFIGTVKVPVGIAGPLRVNGLFAQGDYYLPLATTEAALVASYSRGAQLITQAGGCAAALLMEGVVRAPGFAFKDLREAGLFVSWVMAGMDALRAAAESTTRHGKLVDMRVAVEGNHVYLMLEFTTGDAAGQNMVTIATQAVCAYIDQHSPIKPQYSFVEANLSGDKKASALSFLSVRGKRVTAEVYLARAGDQGVAHHSGADGELLAHVRDRRRVERHHGPAGPLCQRLGGALHRLRTGRRVRFRVGGRRDALRAGRRRRAVRGGDHAQLNRGQRRRRHRLAEPACLPRDLGPRRSGPCAGLGRGLRRAVARG